MSNERSKNGRLPEEPAEQITNAPSLQRRGVLAAIARAGGLLLIIVGGGWLIRRQSANSSGGAGSGAENPCARCAGLFRCLLPQAEDARRRGTGLAGPVRRAVDDAPIGAADIGCAEGREVYRKASDG